MRRTKAERISGLIRYMQSHACAQDIAFRHALRGAQSLLGLADLDLAHEFSVGKPTIERWREGASAPHKYLRKHVWEFILTKALETQKEFPVWTFKGSFNLETCSLVHGVGTRGDAYVAIGRGLYDFGDSIAVQIRTGQFVGYDGGRWNVIDRGEHLPPVLPPKSAVPEGELKPFFMSSVPNSQTLTQLSLSPIVTDPTLKIAGAEKLSRKIDWQLWTVFASMIGVLAALGAVLYYAAKN